MKKRNIALIIVAISLVTGIVVYKINYPSGTWRYRLTVNVETPEGLKTGSAVRELHAALSPINLPGVSSSAPGIKGEAVVVDLGERGTLFALINSSSYNELYGAFPYQGKKPGDGIRYYRSLKPGTVKEVTQNIPTMVMFKDIDDPKSVTLVRGGQFDTKTQKSILVDDFEKLFGKGVSLKSVTVEITDERVTQGVVDEYLPSKLEELKANWKKLPYSEMQRINSLIRFKKGE